MRTKRSYRGRGGGHGPSLGRPGSPIRHEHAAISSWGPGAIYWSRIPRVVFGCSAVELGVVAGGSLVMPSRQVFASGTRRVEVVGPVLETEALAVHRAYWSAR